MQALHNSIVIVSRHFPWELSSGRSPQTFPMIVSPRLIPAWPFLHDILSLVMHVANGHKTSEECIFVTLAVRLIW